MQIKERCWGKEPHTNCEAALRLPDSDPVLHHIKECLSSFWRLDLNQKWTLNWLKIPDTLGNPVWNNSNGSGGFKKAHWKTRCVSHWNAVRLNMYENAQTSCTSRVIKTFSKQPETWQLCTIKQTFPWTIFHLFIPLLNVNYRCSSGTSLHICGPFLCHSGAPSSLHSSWQQQTTQREGPFVMQQHPWDT